MKLQSSSQPSASPTTNRRRDCPWRTCFTLDLGMMIRCDGAKMIDKILTYRVFENELGKMDKNVQQVNGGFTVGVAVYPPRQYPIGRRPDFGPRWRPTPPKLCLLR